MNSGERSNRVVDVENPDALPAGGPEIKTRKSLALKILALKCVSHLKWNFQLLENRYFDYITNLKDFLLISSICRVPLRLQQLLYEDLLFFVEGGKVDIQSHINIDYGEATPHMIFAVSTYHRWILWALRSSQIISKPNKIIHIPM